MSAKARLYLWFLNWVYIAQGIVGVLSFGFIDINDLALKMMRKYLDYWN